MALSDHVRDGERNPAWPRRDTARSAWSDGPAFLRGSFGPPRSATTISAMSSMKPRPTNSIACAACWRRSCSGLPKRAPENWVLAPIGC